MANVSWSFYRSRRRIDIRALVNARRITDYPSYLSYCAEVRVLPAGLKDFELEFGPVLSSSSAAPAQPVTAEPPVSPAANGLEATVWLAGVDDDASTRPTSAPPKSAKKKKSKEEPPE